MASDASKIVRPDFLEVYYRVADCEFCMMKKNDIPAARVLHKNVNLFVETKAAFKCFDVIVVPLTSYISTEIMMSPQLLRFFLCNVHTITDDGKFYQVKTFLDSHSSLHPPCRPGMSEYYLSVLNQHLGSAVFDNQMISDTFFDFVKRLKVAITQYVKPATPTVAEVVTRKEAIDFLKQTCKSSKPKTSACPRLNVLMFVFKYCVDVLIHDYRASRRTSTVPLVVKIVWGEDVKPSMNPHCSDIVNMYLKAPESYRLDIAWYLTLLSAALQKGEIPEEDFFWELGTNELVDTLAQKLTEDEDLSEESLRFVTTIPSKLLQCQLSQSLMFNEILNGARYPNKTSLSRKNSRNKKYFPMFDKKSKK